MFRTFSPTGAFQLWVDGKEIPGAKVHHCDRASSFLVEMAADAGLWLLNLPTGQASSLQRAAIEVSGGTELVLRDTVASVQSVALREHAGGLRWSWREREYRLMPAAPLLGTSNGADLRRHRPEFGGYPTNRSQTSGEPADGAKHRYSMGSDAQATHAAQELQGLTLRVYFGSWNRASRELLPRLAASEQEFGRQGLRIEYRGVGEPLDQDPEARAAGVLSLPSAVLFDADGSELGRIEGLAWQQPGETLERLLAEMPDAASSLEVVR